MRGRNMATKEEIIKEAIAESGIEGIKKMKDFWERHNISTRMLTIIFGLSFIGVVVAGMMKVAIPATIINMVWYSTIIAFGVLTLGINGIEKLLEGIAKIKYGDVKPVN